LDAIVDGRAIGCSLESRQGSTIVDLTIDNRYSIIRTGSVLLNTLRTFVSIWIEGIIMNKLLRIVINNKELMDQTNNFFYHQ